MRTRLTTIPAAHFCIEHGMAQSYTIVLRAPNLRVKVGGPSSRQKRDAVGTRGRWHRIVIPASTSVLPVYLAQLSAYYGRVLRLGDKSEEAVHGAQRDRPETPLVMEGGYATICWLGMFRTNTGDEEHLVSLAHGGRIDGGCAAVCGFRISQISLRTRCEIAG